MRIIRSFFSLIRLFIITGMFLALLLVGMATGGFFLLDWIVTGEMVLVPNLYGKPESEAIELLVKQGLMPKLPVEERTSSYVKPGLVISQHPAPDAPVKKHRYISMVISKGREKVFVPDFTNRDVSDIYGDMRSAGLETGQQARVYHPTYDAGIIISQEPSSGRRFMYGKRINLLISLGPRPKEYIMPNFLNMDLDYVNQNLQNKSFDIPEDGIEFERSTDITKWSKVLKQHPAAGSRVLQNERIKITVGSSGLEMAELRLIEINFPVPKNVYRENLQLVIRDDISSLFDEPSVIPLNIEYWQKQIDMAIPVFGNALVTLSAISDISQFPSQPMLYSQYFPTQ